MMPDYLPTAPRLALILLLAVAGFTVGFVVDVALWLRNRRLWEGTSLTIDETNRMHRLAAVGLDEDEAEAVREAVRREDRDGR